MKYPMDKTLKFWVEQEFETSKRKYPNLSQSQLIASILCEFEGAGHASRFVRRDGKIGWRATDKMREDLFEQEQAALNDDHD